jgi:colanic acid/amylovoran biosynthesis glycosyltransferase
LSETSQPPQPIAAQYLATFLKPEMLHVYRQIRALRAFRPLVFCQKREETERFPFDDVVVTPKPRTHQLRRLWQKSFLGQPIEMYEGEAKRLAARLVKAEARVLHVYFGHIGVYLLPLLKLARVPAVISFHGADAQVDHENPSFLGRLEAVFANVRLVLARSDSIARRLIACGCPSEKIRLHRTGIPLEEIPFSPRRPPPDGAWRCLQACRFIAKKGLGTTLEAFAKFSERYPLSTLTLAGDGPLMGELRARADALGLRDRVFFPGFVSQGTLHDLYRESHLFLHPSEMGANGDQEGVPNSMLEAMATGLPVVATQHGGIPEAVEQGVSGSLVPEGDVEAMAEAMFQLADNTAGYTAMNAASAKRVMAEFDLQRQTRILESYYQEALEAK